MASAISGGYDCEFVDEVNDDYICVICSSALRDPLQFVACGHRVCEICFQRMVEHAQGRGTELSCPFDRAIVNPNEVFPDKGIARRVLDLKVYCSSKAKGCKWVGELRELKGHKETCRKNNPLACALDDIDFLKSRVEHLEIKLTEKDQEIKYCNETIRCLKNKEDESTKALEETIEKLNNKFAEQGNHIKNIEDRNKQKENEMMKTSEETNKKLTDQLAVQNNHIKNIEDNNRKQNENIKSLGNTITELANQLRNYVKKDDNLMKEKTSTNTYEWVVGRKDLRSGWWHYSEEFYLSTLPYSFMLGGKIGKHGLDVQLDILPGEHKTRVNEIERRLKGIAFEVYLKGKDGRVDSKKVTVKDASLRLVGNDLLGNTYAFFIWQPFLLACNLEQWMHNNNFQICCKIE